MYFLGKKPEITHLKWFIQQTILPTIDWKGLWLSILRPLCTYSVPAAAAAKSLLSCPTLCDPIDSSPPGSPVPGILPGKTTGVGCHFLLQCMKVKSESEVAQLCPTLSDPMDCSPPGILHPWDFPGKSTGWGATAFSSA